MVRLETTARGDQMTNLDQIQMLRDFIEFKFIFSEAQIEQANDGQYIIYPGIFEDSSPAT